METSHPKKLNKVKPTELQLRAFNLAKSHPKWPWNKVMREAGYKGKSPKAPGHNLLATRGFIAAQALWPDALASRGIHIQRLAEKFNQLLDAKKATDFGLVDDNQIQLKTAIELKKDLGIGQGDPHSEEKSITFKWKRPVP